MGKTYSERVHRTSSDFIVEREQCRSFLLNMTDCRQEVQQERGAGCCVRPTPVPSKTTLESLGTEKRTKRIGSLVIQTIKFQTKNFNMVKRTVSCLFFFLTKNVHDTP